MPFHPGSGNEFRSAGTKDQRADAHPRRADHRHLDSLEQALAEMDSVISLTHIPDLFADDGATHSPSETNLFAAATASDEDAVRVNMLRQTGRSLAVQGRVLALRRRATRKRQGQTAPAAPAVKVEDELRQLRTRIFTITDEERALAERPSVPLRLATHVIGLSLVVTALPVGAAMMTYNLLNGEDMQMTARLTTLTGLGLAVLSGNPELALLIGA